MRIHIKSYEEFTDELKALDGYHGETKCFVLGCEEPAYYEGGDARFYCGVCEEHARIKERYTGYLQNIRDRVLTRMKWDKSDPTLTGLYKMVTDKILEVELHAAIRNELIISKDTIEIYDDYRE